MEVEDTRVDAGQLVLSDGDADEGREHALRAGVDELPAVGREGRHTGVEDEGAAADDADAADAGVVFRQALEHRCEFGRVHALGLGAAGLPRLTGPDEGFRAWPDEAQAAPARVSALRTRAASLSA